jgi:hypothetical protein
MICEVIPVCERERERRRREKKRVWSESGRENQ